MLCVPVVVAAFPPMGRVDGMGGLGTTPSIESVRCCGIAENLQETPQLATRFGLFRGPATLSRICSHFVLFPRQPVRRRRPFPYFTSSVPGGDDKHDPERESWPCSLMQPILPIQSISGSRLSSPPGTLLTDAAVMTYPLDSVGGGPCSCLFDILSLLGTFRTLFRVCVLSLLILEF